MSSQLHHMFYRCFYAVLALAFSQVIFAQQVNTVPKADTFFLAKKKGLLGKLGRSISIDTPTDTLGTAIKNIDPFIAFKDKIIHSIIIKEISFGGSVNDTSAIRKSFFLRLADDMHVSTRQHIIRDNLFFKVGEAFFPNLVADNERFLREQSYLQDARIIVTPVHSDTSLIDVTVVYKDVFSISGSGVLNGRNYFGEIKDDNLAGRGQSLAFKALFDLDRKTKTGFGVEYAKRNIKGSFFNYTVGYKNIEPAFNTGRRDQTSLYSRLELPLVSPYSLWTGTIEASVHYTTNQYFTDSLFKINFNYRYHIYDAWAGYNITHKTSNEAVIRKVKQFVGLRLSQRTFYEVPGVYASFYNYQYADVKSILASYTIFKQLYYRTTFLYGFGRNEDVPEGFNYSVIAGWASKQQVSRPYIGIDFEKNYFTKRKSYFTHNLKLGAYVRNGKFEDVGLLLSLETFTKLRRLGGSKWYTRHFLTGSIAQQFSHSLDEPITISSNYGLSDFGIDTATRSQSRYSISCTSVFYNTWKVAGFNFAPFAFTNLSYLRPLNAPAFSGDGFASVGAGVRTRNENLVFGTMELRAAYYPRTVGNMNVWNITFNTDLRFRYNSTYIKRPDFVGVNR